MSITFVITILQNVLEVNINEYYICYYNIKLKHLAQKE